MKARMYNSSSALTLKQEFFKKWIKGLQIYSNLKKEMTILERKRAIKLSADVAISSARSVSTHWSKALMADSAAAGVGGAAGVVVEQMLGRRVKALMNITCSNKIVRRSCRAHRRRVVRSSVKATSIAKKLVKNRTRVLQRLVPGGRQIVDEVSLIKETLDYIASLQVQVDVMRHLAAAAETLDLQQRFF